MEWNGNDINMLFGCDGAVVIVVVNGVDVDGSGALDIYQKC